MKPRKILLIILFLLALLWFAGKWLQSENGGQKAIFKIGRDQTWYPLDVHGKEKNMVGFTNELIRSVSNQGNFQTQIVNLPTSGMMDALRKGRVDAIFSTMSPSVVNKSKYEFSSSFYLAGPVVVVEKNSPVTSLQDLDGKVVGIEAGDEVIWRLKEIPTFLVVPYSSPTQALDDLVKKNLDAVIIDILDAASFERGVMNGQIKIATAPLTQYGLRLVALKHPQAVKMISRFDEALKEIEKEGIVKKLVNKWNLIDTSYEN